MILKWTWNLEKTHLSMREGQINKFQLLLQEIDCRKSVKTSRGNSNLSEDYRVLDNR